MRFRDVQIGQRVQRTMGPAAAVQGLNNTPPRTPRIGIIASEPIKSSLHSTSVAILWEDGTTSPEPVRVQRLALLPPEQQHPALGGEWQAPSNWRGLALLESKPAARTLTAAC
jgi:hypothetical protein